MLVMNDLLARARRNNDDGAVLMAVLMVMIVGFIVASVIASAIIFTISFNTKDRMSLQAFTAAESGRDAAVAELHSTAGCTAGTTTVSNAGSDPVYTATIYASSSATQPTSESGLTASCPTSSSTFVVIKSTGTASTGTTATIDAVYPWQVIPHNQAGGVLTYFSNGVSSQSSNYTGDLVVRSGTYTCPNAGTINGDLYVVSGNAGFSSGCTVNGNVYVSGNVDLSSQNIKITGSIQAGGNVTGSSNGVTVGDGAAGDGNISAGGSVTLSNTGSTLGKVTGSITAASTITVGSQWTVTGTKSPNTAFTPFNPTMAWVYSATAWVDLDASSNWNPSVSVNPCSLTNAQVTSLLSAATTSLMLDYTQCSGNRADITLNAGSITRDAVFIVPTAARMNVSIAGSLTGAHQLFFIHSDASRNLVNGQTQPDCGNGTQKDTFGISSGVTVAPDILLYSPCGLTGNVNVSFQGQMYTNQGGLTFNNPASYTCQSMSWPVVLPNLACRIRGGGGIFDPGSDQSLGGRLWQSEK